ncbi:MAG: Holliday junction resolvase RuvX [Bacteroidales bacterium]
MGRIMAIDYGRKRVGLAVTDPQQIIATALDTVPAARIFDYLKEYLSREEVEQFVVGEPRRMNNMPSESVQYIEPFVKKLRKTFPGIPVERYDERFTSLIASRAMIEGGLPKAKRREKERVDRMSAVLILQSWMEFAHRK